MGSKATRSAGWRRPARRRCDAIDGHHPLFPSRNFLESTFDLGRGALTPSQIEHSAEILRLGRRAVRWRQRLEASPLRRSQIARVLVGGLIAGTENAAVNLEAEMRAESEEQKTLIKNAWVLFLWLYAGAWHQLSQRDRRTLHLVEVEGLSYQEAGRILDVGRSNMKMIVFRSRKRIARHIRVAMNASRLESKKTAGAA